MEPIEHIKIKKDMEVSELVKGMGKMGFGAGMGLSNIKKNIDQLEIQSTINKGTVVEMISFIPSTSKQS